MAQGRVAPGTGAGRDMSTRGQPALAVLPEARKATDPSGYWNRNYAVAVLGDRENSALPGLR